VRVGVRNFSPAFLRQAREARGITGVTLAELIGVTRQAISQYEGGASAPSPDVLERLSTHLNLPLGYFVRAGNPPAAENSIFFRSLAAATKTARVRERNRLAWHLEIVDYISRYVVFPDVDFPSIKGETAPGEWTLEDIEAVATATRNHWGLGNQPIPDLTEVLERHGAIVLRCELGADSLDAFSTWHLNTPHIVLSSGKRSAVRSRYDAAHELAHQVLHRQCTTAMLSRTTNLKAVEAEAHLFAGAFLLPAETFADEVVLPTLDGLLGLKPRWRASVGAMIMRARQLELIGDLEQRRLWVGYSSRSWRREEPLDDSLPIEQPRLLANAFKIAIADARLGFAEIQQSLPYAVRDLEQLIGLPENFFKESLPPLVTSRSNAPRVADVGRGIVVQFPGERAESTLRPRDA